MIGSSRVGRSGAAALGVLVAALVAGAVAGPAGVAQAAPGPAVHAAGVPAAAPATSAARLSQHWRFDASAATVADVARVVRADRLQALGLTGEGVGVALVDTGVVPVPGLSAGQVVDGPDLSLDSLNPDARNLDTYGHGTHLAGIVAGLAPRVTLDSVKVGAFDGAVDVSQVIAGLDWVVAHRDDDPAHPIRVVNLSFGTDGGQDYRIDPLADAVENAWRAGIVVVVAAGNGGAAGALTDPAYDPYVLAVGASDTNGTVGTLDDSVTEFSSRGGAGRRPDLVAPGKSIVSLRDPGSYIDTANPGARVGDQLFKGSGTSQAAAVVSGAVALLLQARPDLTPDQVKAALTRAAVRLPGGDPGQGAGELDVARALLAPVAGAAQKWARSTGTGSLEAARGGAHLTVGGAELSGENTLWGPFEAAAWARASAAGTAWVGAAWMGHDLTTTWTGAAWSGLYWSGLYWSGLYWSGLYWSGLYWSGLYWSGLYWSGLYWSDQSWTG